MRHHWKRRREQASHTDDWLMTYADMITLLLCFFAIFLSVSIPKKNALPIKPPDMLEGNLPLHGVQYTEHKSEDGSVKVSIDPLPEPVKLPRQPQPEDLDNLDNSTLQRVVIPNEPMKPIPPSIEELAAKGAAPTPATLPEIVDRLKDSGPADIEQKGDRITTLQMNSGAFFEVGSASLSNQGKSILRDVAANLKSDKFKDYNVAVEGHTDDSPIATPQFPSNWELSTARAAAVVKFFLDQGIPPQKLRAAGYADTFPVAPNRDAAGKPIPENQARNRRVVINLERIVKGD